MKKVAFFWIAPVVFYLAAAAFKLKTASAYREAQAAYSVASTNAYEAIAACKRHEAQLNDEFDGRMKYYRLFHGMETAGWSNILVVGMKDEKLFMAPLAIDPISDKVFGIPLIEIEKEEKPSGLRRYRKDW